MKKIFFAILMLTFSVNIYAGVIPSNRINSNHNKNNIVFICTGPRAYVYHSTPNCSGLSRCSGSIVKVSSTMALKRYHRRACKRCY